MPLRKLLSVLFDAYRRHTAFDLASLSRRFRFTVTGVLHVGANMGQEAEIYWQLGARRVIWIEGFEDYFQKLKTKIAPYPGQEAHCLLVSDHDNEELQFRIASNTGSSTAMAPGANFSRNFDGINFNRSISLRANRLDTYFRDNDVSLTNVNVLVLDLEGFELKALRSLADLMETFNWAICEVSLTANFVGGPLLRDIDAFFLAHGFRRRALKCGLTSGDGLYERHAASVGDLIAMILSRNWATFSAKSGLYRLKRMVGHF